MFNIDLILNIFLISNIFNLNIYFPFSDFKNS